MSPPATHTHTYTPTLPFRYSVFFIETDNNPTRRGSSTPVFSSEHVQEATVPHTFRYAPLGKQSKTHTNIHTPSQIYKNNKVGLGSARSVQQSKANGCRQ